MAKNSLTDLLAQKAALDKQIALLQNSQRNDAIAKVKSLMADYGLTPADIGAAAAARNTAAAVAAAPAPAPAKGKPKKSPSAGKKVAPKYRNNATGETWSGRGLKPKWLSAAIAGGKSLADFAL